MNPVVLIIGITGGSGAAFAKACQDKNWRVKALHRNPDKAKLKFAHQPGINWIKGDAMSAEDIAMAAKGSDIIFHGVNPPGYKNWRKLAIPMLDNSIKAAIAQKARLVMPGNVYNYGPDAMPLISENSPQNPITKKGSIRVEMEEMLQQAATRGAKVLIVRAGDFFGPDAAGSWFGQAIVKPGKKLKSVAYPGDPNIGHNWAYLPDLAATFCRLLERQDELTDFEVFHFGGHYFPRGITIADKTMEIARITGAPIKKMPWMMIQLASPFIALFKELLEMRYLWNEDLQLDNTKLCAFLGAEPHTAIIEALGETLTSLKCI